MTKTAPTVNYHVISLWIEHIRHICCVIVTRIRNESDSNDNVINNIREDNEVHNNDSVNDKTANMDSEDNDNDSYNKNANRINFDNNDMSDNTNNNDHDNIDNN